MLRLVSRWLLGREDHDQEEERLLPISRRQPPIEPIRHDQELDRFTGMWVAVDESRKIRAAAPSSRELAWEIRKLGLGGKVTAQYVTPPTEGLRVGLG